MHAIVRPARIDIEGSSAIAREKWDPLLDDLKAVHIPGLTPTGKGLWLLSAPPGGLTPLLIVLVCRTKT
jgi:hypothetical protein